MHSVAGASALAAACIRRPLSRRISVVSVSVVGVGTWQPPCPYCEFELWTRLWVRLPGRTAMERTDHTRELRNTPWTTLLTDTLDQRQRADVAPAAATGNSRMSQPDLCIVNGLLHPWLRHSCRHLDTRSSAIADRPCGASCCWVFSLVAEGCSLEGVIWWLPQI